MSVSSISCMYSVRRLVGNVLRLLIVFPLMNTWLTVVAYSDHRNRKIDSMETVLCDKQLSWKDQLKAHSELMWGYLQTNGEKSVYHAKEILRLTEGVAGEGIATRQNAFRILGQHAYAVCLYDSALHCYQRSLEMAQQAEKSGLYKQSDIDDIYSALYGTMGNLYNIQGMTTIAMDYYFKALPIFERNNWQESISTLFYNIGEMYLEMGNNAEARKAYQKSLNAALKTGDSLILVNPRHGLATVLLNEGKPYEALREERESMKYLLSHPTEESFGLMNAYVMLAHIYWEGLNDMQTAQQMMDAALKISNGMDETSDLSDAYSTQAALCLNRREWQNAIDWCLRSLDVNDQDPHHNIVVYKLLAEAYSYQGKAEESTQYLKLLHNTMEEMANQRHQSALSEMQIRYETQQKEAKIAQMRERVRLMWWIDALVLFVFVLIFIAFWRISKQRRRTLAIQSKLKGEREERQRLAHDLHDRVGSMLTAMRLTLEQDKKEDTLEMLSQTSTELRKVAHHLMPESLSRKGLHVALSDYCSVLPDVTFHYFGEPHRLSEEIEVLCYSMIHELINNALRHASATRIQVQLMYESDCISAIVADNGKGFDVNAPHQGIGLSNIRQRIAIHNGRLSVTSSPGGGSEVHFEIPLDKTNQK